MSFRKRVPYALWLSPINLLSPVYAPTVPSPVIVSLIKVSVPLFWQLPSSWQIPWSRHKGTTCFCFWKESYIYGLFFSEPCCSCSYDSNFREYPMTFHNFSSLCCTLDRNICDELWSVSPFLVPVKTLASRGHLFLLYFLWTFQFVTGTECNWMLQLYLTLACVLLTAACRFLFLCACNPCFFKV